jgi:hypothetical protein
VGQHGPVDRLALPADRLGRLARSIGDDLDAVVLTDPMTVGFQAADALPELINAFGGARAR